MAKKQKKAEAKKKKPAKASTPTPEKRAPPVAMIVRRNSAPKRLESRPAATATAAVSDDEESRMERMGAWHVATGMGGAMLGQTLGVVTVGQGWLGPKLTSSLMLGAGLSVAAAGYYWEIDHLLSGGAGMATAGALALTNQLAVDSYVRMEERAERKRAEKEAKEEEEAHVKQLAEAKALLESEEARKKKRNARRIVVLDHTGQPIEDADEYETVHAAA